MLTKEVGMRTCLRVIDSLLLGLAAAMPAGAAVLDY